MLSTALRYRNSWVGFTNLFSVGVQAITTRQVGLANDRAGAQDRGGSNTPFFAFLVCVPWPVATNDRLDDCLRAESGAAATSGAVAPPFRYRDLCMLLSLQLWHRSPDKVDLT